MRIIAGLFALLILIAGCTVPNTGKMVDSGNSTSSGVNYGDEYIVNDSSQLSEIR